MELQLVDFDYLVNNYQKVPNLQNPEYLLTSASDRGWAGQPPTAFSKMVTYTPVSNVPQVFEVNRYGHDISYSSAKVQWQVTHNLDLPTIKAATKGWLDEQVTHRSRVATLGGGETLVGEFNYKVAVFNAIKEKLPPETEDGGELERKFVLDLLVGLKSSLVKDMDNFNHFITEHKESSVRPGLFWEMLRDDEAIMSQLYEYWDMALAYFIENVSEWQDMYSHIPYYQGMRSRVTEPFRRDINKEIATFDVLVDRTRNILYNQHHSTAFAVTDLDKFKTVKVDAYRKWQSDSGLQAKQAYIHGVETYTYMDEQKHNIYSALDGIAWEAFVIKLCPWLAPWSSNYSADMNVLATGNFMTTIGGIAAAFNLYRRLMENQWYGRDLSLQGNSDDMGIISYDGKPVEAIMPLSEDKLDTKLKFMLGFSFIQDSIHPVGVKLTKDNAVDHEPIGSGSLTLARTLSDEEIKNVVSVYQGFVGEVPILDHLKLISKKIDRMDWISPRRIIDEISVPGGDTQE